MTRIQPKRSGPELIQDIHAAEPAPGTVAIWWLGQSGFLVKSQSGVLVVDPYLSDSLTKKYAHTDKPHDRMTDIPIQSGELTDVDLVLSSHKHTDHMDPETLVPLMGRNAGAELAVPETFIHHVEKMGVPARRLFGLDAGWTCERAGFQVRAIPSAHEGVDQDAFGRHLYLGFIIEVDGVRVYHSGDTVVFPELLEWLGGERFDVLMLPINGRDPGRGVPGNMTAGEAVELACELRPRWIVPHHYDMFTFNTVPISLFEREAGRLPSGVNARIMQCGERWEVLP